MSDDPLYREARKFAHLTSGTTILRPTGQSAWLHRVVVNSDTAGTITVYNNGAASGEVVAILTIKTGFELLYSQHYDVGLDTGCTVVLSTTMDITVIYE